MGCPPRADAAARVSAAKSRDFPSSYVAKRSSAAPLSEARRVRWRSSSSDQKAILTPPRTRPVRESSLAKVVSTLPNRLAERPIIMSKPAAAVAP